MKLTNYQPRLEKALQDQLGDFFTPVIFDLFRRMLTLNPRKRISAEKILEHEFFKTGESSKDLLDSGKTISVDFDSLHELEAKRMKQKKRKAMNLSDGEIDQEPPSQDLAQTGPVSNPEQQSIKNSEFYERTTVQSQNMTRSDYTLDNGNAATSMEPDQAIQVSRLPPPPPPIDQPEYYYKDASHGQYRAGTQVDERRGSFNSSQFYPRTGSFNNFENEPVAPQGRHASDHYKRYGSRSPSYSRNVDAQEFDANGRNNAIYDGYEHDERTSYREPSNYRQSQNNESDYYDRYQPDGRRGYNRSSPQRRRSFQSWENVSESHHRRLSSNRENQFQRHRDSNREFRQSRSRSRDRANYKRRRQWDRSLSKDRRPRSSRRY